MRYLLILCCVFLYLASPDSEAACSSQSIDRQDNYVVYTGDCTDDNETLIVASVIDYEACFIFSTTGAVDVFVSLDGSNYTTAALSLRDLGATNTNPVLVTAAGRLYGFAAKFRRVRILENGATDAAASLLCFDYN